MIAHFKEKSRIRGCLGIRLYVNEQRETHLDRCKNVCYNNRKQQRLYSAQVALALNCYGFSGCASGTETTNNTKHIKLCKTFLCDTTYLQVLQYLLKKLELIIDEYDVHVIEFQDFGIFRIQKKDQIIDILKNLSLHYKKISMNL